MTRHQWWFILGFTAAIIAIAVALTAVEDRIAYNDAAEKARQTADRNLALIHWNIPDADSSVVRKYSPPAPLKGEAQFQRRESLAAQHVDSTFFMRNFTDVSTILSGSRTRLISRTSTNIRHQPDPWELGTISQESHESKEFVGLQEFGGEPVLRLLRPLEVSSKCLYCHGVWTNAETDDRPAISVILPMREFQGSRDRRVNMSNSFLAILWVVVTMTFVLFALRYNKRREAVVAAMSGAKSIEAQFTAVWESSRDGMRLTDENGTTVAVNDAYCRLVGKDRADLLNKLYTLVYPVEERDRRLSRYKARFASGKIEPVFERKVTLWNGRRLWVEASTASFVAPDGAARLLTITRDISKRKGAEIELADISRKYREMFEDAPVGYHEFDKEGRLTWVNRTELEMTGYTSEEMVGHYVWEYVADPDASRLSVLAKLSGAKAPSKAAHRDYSRKDGTRFPVLVEDRLLRNEAGNITGIRTTLQDATEIKRMEQALRESAETLTSVIEGIGIGISFSDADGRFHVYNSALRSITGYSQIEANAGRDFPASIFGATHQKGAFPAAEQLLSGSLNDETIEATITAKDGKTKHVALTHRIIAHNNGRMLVSTWQDITARNSAERKVLEERQKLLAITGSANDAIIMIDEKGKINFWNPGAERILGYEEHEALGRDPSTLIIPERHQEAHRNAFQKFQETGTGGALGKTLELSALRKDGTEVAVALSLSAVNSGQLRHAVGLLRDITEQKRAELRRTVLYDIAHAAIAQDNLDDFFSTIRQNLSKLVDTTNFYVAIYDDASGKVSFPYFVDQADTQPSPRLLGHGLTDYVIRTGKPLFADAKMSEELNREGLAKVIGTPSALWLGVPLKIGNTVSGVIVVQSYDDPQCYDLEDLAILEYVASQLTQTIIRKRSEVMVRSQMATIEDNNIALARARDQALEASRTKSSFLANMSHELRTPLNAIIGYSEILLEDFTGDAHEGHAEDIQKIHAAGSHLLALINDILDLSKIEAGRMELYVEEFDLGGLLAEINATIQPLVSKKGNRLAIVAPETPVRLRLDHTKVRQVLFNLLSNASKFTEKGEISLTARVERSASPEGTDRIVFVVKDSGIGMTPDQLKRIFQEFTQADTSTTRKYGGTGLGLTISKRFCEMMQGAIDVQSIPSLGTTFSVTLPARLERQESPAEAAVEHGIDAPLITAKHGTTVLIIDDDENVRDLLTRVLIKEGYSVATASNGVEGMKVARTTMPALLILDVMMPAKDGWAVLKDWREDPLLRDIPVIMHSIIDNKNLGFALGARDYLIKPVDHDTLVQALRRYKSPARPMDVLIVDDDSRQREILSRVLALEGHQAMTAEGGHAALEVLAQSIPDVIILDMMMPAMDGFEFLKVIREREAWMGIPVIILTSMDISGQAVRNISSSVVGVMQKGELDHEQLLSLIRRYDPTK